MCPTTLLYAATALATAIDEVDVRWAVDPPSPYVGQAFELALVISFETAWAEESLAQLFPQELDVPIQVEGFGGLPESLIEVSAPDIVRGATVALEGEVASAERSRDGARTILRSRKVCRAVRAGTFDLSAPTVRFASATEFRDDFVRGRVAVDLNESTARGEALALEVRPLPESGRPVTFDGAVGEFTLEADVAPRALRVGEITTLEVRVAGDAPLPPGVAPRLAEMDGFELVAESRRDAGRASVFAFDLRVADAALTQGPVAQLASFDPSRAQPTYTLVKSEAVSIAVRPRQDDSQTPSTIDDPEPPTASPRLPWTLGVLAFIGVLAVVSSVRRIRYRSTARRERDATTGGSQP